MNKIYISSSPRSFKSVKSFFEKRPRKKINYDSQNNIVLDDESDLDLEMLDVESRKPYATKVGQLRQ